MEQGPYIDDDGFVVLPKDSQSPVSKSKETPTASIVVTTPRQAEKELLSSDAKKDDELAATTQPTDDIPKKLEVSVSPPPAPESAQPIPSSQTPKAEGSKTPPLSPKLSMQPEHRPPPPILSPAHGSSLNELSTVALETQAAAVGSPAPSIRTTRSSTFSTFTRCLTQCFEALFARLCCCCPHDDVKKLKRP